jgi:AcrR family transcriptional regulator
MASLTRRERSRATHWKIVEAAHHLFSTQGYAATTMTQVAETAGVAVQTVYFVFHTKPALLARAIDFAVMGRDDPRPPFEQQWYRAMTDAPGIAEALRHLVTGVGTIMPRVIPLNLAARASDDPDLARIMAESEAWRADGYRAILEILRSKAPLRDGLDPERGAHLLLLYVSEDVYHFLVGTYGWPHDDWVDWTVAALLHEVFGLAISPEALSPEAFDSGLWPNAEHAQSGDGVPSPGG